MKKHILTLACFLFFITVYAQVEPKKDVRKQMTNEELAQFYQHKSKNLKKTGRILMWSGLGLYAATIVVGLIELNGDSDGTTTLVLFWSGTVSLASCLPFFIAGSNNKNRANLLIKQNNIPVSLDRNRNIPLKSIGIGFTLGK